MAPRLKEKYVSEIREALRAEFKHENVMQVGGLTKIVVNMGVGEAARDSKALEGAIRDLTAITGQKPVTTRAKKSIAQFKLREGQAIGVPQVRTVPRVPARACPPWRAPRCHQEQLVKRTSQVPGNRRNRDEEGE